MGNKCYCGLDLLNIHNLRAPSTHRKKSHFDSLKGPFTQIKIEPIWLSNRAIVYYLYIILEPIWPFLKSHFIGSPRRAKKLTLRRVFLDILHWVFLKSQNGSFLSVCVYVPVSKIATQSGLVWHPGLPLLVRPLDSWTANTIINLWMLPDCVLAIAYNLFYLLYSPQ